MWIILIIVIIIIRIVKDLLSTSDLMKNLLLEASLEPQQKKAKKMNDSKTPQIVQFLLRSSHEFNLSLLSNNDWSELFELLKKPDKKSKW